MGNVDSSALDSIRTLSQSLTDIERKLTSIEDVHLHHDRTLCHDDVVVLSGRRVKCRSAVKVTVGPICGIISSSSIKILLETDHGTELTFNVFHVDEHIPEGRFLRSQSHTIINGNIASAFIINELQPGTQYAVYIGGIHPEETLTKYVEVSTLSHRAEDVRLAVLSQGYAGVEVPGEDDLWSKLLDTTLANDGKAFNAVISNDHDSNANIVGGAVDSRNEHAAKFRPNLIVHLGDFVSVDTVTRSSGLRLLEVLSHEDAGEAAWEPVIKQLEESLLQIYRSAFSNDRMQKLFRRCGNIFLTGPAEAATSTADVFDVHDAGPGLTGVAEREAEEAAERERLEEEERDLKKFGVKVVKKAVEAPEPQDSDGGDLDGTDASLVGFQAVLQKELLQSQKRVLHRKQVQDELRRLVFAMVLRVARRLHHRYMRQLWDEGVPAWEAEDLRLEASHKEILRLKRVLWVKADVYRTLTQSLRKLEELVGKDVAAAQQVKACVDTAKADVDEAESMINSAAADVVSVDDLLHAVLPVGAVLLVVLETNWGWLTPAGEVHSATRTNIAVPPHVWTSLSENLLLERLRTGRSLSAQHATEADVPREVTCPFQSVLVFTTYPLMPTGAPENAVPKATFTLKDSDRNDLINCLARWQAGELKRTVLVAQSGTGFAASGWILPPANDGSDDGESDSQVWEHRSALRLLSVGTMVVPPGPAPATLSTLQPLPSTLQYQTKTEGTAHASFSSSLEVHPYGGIGRRSYWLVEHAEPKNLRDGAGFNLSLISDFSEALDDQDYLALGPIIGSITSDSVRILVETSRSESVSVFVCDQLTGVEYVTHQFYQKKRVAAVVVEGLMPARPYCVYLQTERGGGSHFNEIPVAVFTTLSEGALGSVSMTEGKAAEHRAITATRAATPGYRSDRKLALDIESQDPQKFDERKVDRVVLVGGSSTGSSSTLFRQFGGAVNDAGNERQVFINGLDLLRSITSVHSQPWSPISSVLVLGCAVDIGLSFQCASIALAAAEKMPVGSREYLHQMACADTYVRDAYRTHWGGCGAMRDLLQGGSHLTLSDCAGDLCAAIGGCASLDQLKRDLSPFVVDHLLRAVAAAHDDYQAALWPSSSSKHGSVSTQYLSGGAIAIVGLIPNWEMQLDGAGLIGANQWRDLESQMRSEGVSAQAVRVLIIASPLPLIVCEAGQSGRGMTSNKPGVRYTADELFRLFDLLRLWVDDGRAPGVAYSCRQVVLACGGALMPYTSEISGYFTEDSGCSKESPDFKITQVCVCCVTRAPLSGTAAARGHVVSLFAPPTRTRNGIQYKVKHTVSPQSSPVCAMINVQTPDAGDVNIGSEARPLGFLKVTSSFHTSQSLTSLACSSELITNIPKEVQCCLEDALAVMSRPVPSVADDSSDMDLLRFAVRSNLAKEAAVEVIRQAHMSLRAGKFGLLTVDASDAVVVAVLWPLLTWTRRALVEAGVEDVVLGKSSAVTVEHVWKSLVESWPAQRGAQSAVSRRNDAGKGVVSLAMAELLCGDELFFTGLVSDVFEIAVLLQYFGSAMNDGW